MSSTMQWSSGIGAYMLVSNIINVTTTTTTTTTAAAAAAASSTSNTTTTTTNQFIDFFVRIHKHLTVDYPDLFLQFKKKNKK